MHRSTLRELISRPEAGPCSWARPSRRRQHGRGHRGLCRVGVPACTRSDGERWIFAGPLLCPCLHRRHRPSFRDPVYICSTPISQVRRPRFTTLCILLPLTCLVTRAKPELELRSRDSQHASRHVNMRSRSYHMCLACRWTYTSRCTLFFIIRIRLGSLFCQSSKKLRNPCEITARSG